MFSNTDITKGPVGEWDLPTRRKVGYSKDFDDWVNEAYKKSPKVANEWEFISMWRHEFMTWLVESE
jgi:hypothetical protein